MLIGPIFSSIIGFGIGGTGVGLGGLVACVLGRKCERVLGHMLAVMAGLIFSLIFLELLPSSFEAGGKVATILGIVSGLIITRKVERFFQRIVIITGDFQRSLFIRSGFLFAIAVAVHNFPIGLAMGAAMLNEPRVGFDLATAMLFHNFPEGLAISLPMVFSDVNRVFIPVTAFFVAVPAGLGSFLGYSLGSVNPYVLSLLLGIAMGAIFYVTWHEILRHARERLLLASLLLYLCIGAITGKIFSLLR